MKRNLETGIRQKPQIWYCQYYTLHQMLFLTNHISNGTSLKMILMIINLQIWLFREMRITPLLHDKHFNLLKKLDFPKINVVTIQEFKNILF